MQKEWIDFLIALVNSIKEIVMKYIEESFSYKKTIATA